MTRQILSVTELNNIVRADLNADLCLQNVAIQGELSNCKLYPSGHWYFSLKDSESSLKCVKFKNTVPLNFQPQNGLSVIAFGKISVYARDGVYQLYCESMINAGQGNLQLAFEQLKQKLEKQGLFSETHKKPLPRFPERIAVVTSPVGAAVRDIIRILGSRWPMTEVVIVPVRVQGIEAPGEIAEAIRYVNRNNLADLIITGRGGGSAEDLNCFNDESLALAIYESEIPVISAVGHEPDVTISDYVADRRASTPSNAAEIAVPDSQEVRQYLDSVAGKLDPAIYFSNNRREFSRYREKMETAMNVILSSLRQQLAASASTLESMSPLKVLSRGYALPLKNGTGVHGVSELTPGDSLVLKMNDGNAACIVEEVHYGK